MGVVGNGERELPGAFPRCWFTLASPLILALLEMHATAGACVPLVPYRPANNPLNP